MSVVILAIAQALGGSMIPPVWSEYQRALGERKIFSVSFLRMTGADGESDDLYGKTGTLVVQRPDRFRITRPSQSIYWDGKTRTTVSARDNRLVSNHEPIRNGMMDGLGLLEANEVWDRSFYRVRWFPRSRFDRLTSGMQQGMLVCRSGRDATYWAEYWFEPTTHLPFEVTFGADGMTPEYQATYRLTWEFRPISEALLNPKPMTPAERDLPRDRDGVRYSPWGNAPEGKGRLRVTAPLQASGSIQVGDAEFETSTASLVLKEGWFTVATRLSSGEYRVRDGYEVVVSLGAIRNGKQSDLLVKQGEQSVRVASGKTVAVLPGKYVCGPGKITVRPGQTETIR